MANPVKASVDFRLVDNGSATATLTPVDTVGLATTLPAGTSTPTWTSSDPGVVVTAAADGLSAQVTPATPPVLVTGAVITATATLPNNADGSAGATITGSGTPIDVVAGGPAGFQITEA